jgi:O-antigen/teichoic acid export membrane protein
MNIRPYIGERTCRESRERETIACRRSRERYRRVGLTAIAAAFGRGANLITMLISVPLALHYLGNEQFGVFATLVAITAMLGFADLGLGNGLVNAVADANGRDDLVAARRSVSTAFVLLTGLALALAGGFVALYRHVDWAGLLNASTPAAANEAAPAVAALVACMLINLPFGTVQRVQIGLQEGYRASAWNGLGAPLGLGFMAVAISLHLGLAWIVAATTGGLLLASAMNFAVFFFRKRPDLRPAIRDFDPVAAEGLLGAGVGFFVLQLGVVVTFQTDAIVLARIIGPSAVTTYSIPLRLFLFVPLALGLVLAPLWPAYGEALARGDRDWVRQTLVRSLRLTVVVSVAASLILALAAPTLVHLWVGGGVSPRGSLVVAFAIFAVVISASNALSMFLNGTHVIRLQAVLTSVMIFANLGLSIVLTRRVGISGVLWGTIVAQTTCFLIPAAFVVRRLLHSSAPTASLAPRTDDGDFAGDRSDRGGSIAAGLEPTAQGAVTHGG